MKSLRNFQLLRKKNLGKNRIDFEEKFKSIEGDGNFIGDKDLQNELYPNMNVFEFLKHLYEARKNDEKEIGLVKFNQDNIKKINNVK